MKLRGRSQTTYCIAHIWCWPTPVVTIVVGACGQTLDGWTTCWGLSQLVARVVAERELVAPRAIWSSQGVGRGAPSARRAPTASASSRERRPSGPTTGMSALRSFEISAGSMSRWTMVAPGANAASFP